MNGERAKAPWHFWAIGVLALLWYASGAITIQLAQIGQLPSLTPDEAAYYAAKPTWLVVTTAIATYGSVLAALLMLLRMKAAVATYALAVAFIGLNNGIELANGTSRALANGTAAAVTAIILAIALFMVWYSWTMRQKGVLR